MSLDVTLDRRRAFMRPEWHTGPRRRPDAVVLALPSLATLRRVNPEQYRDPTAPTVASLSPEGTRVVIVTRAFAYATDVDAPATLPRSFPLRERQCIDARVAWVGQERAWVAVKTLNVYAEPGNLYALDLSRGAWTVLRTERLDDALPKSLAVDADGRRVAGVGDPRGGAQNKTLFVIDATTGEVTSSRSLGVTLRAVCWARDERSLLTVGARGASVEVHRWSAEGGPAERLTRIASEGPHTEAAVAPVGDDAALITRDDSAGGAFASLVSLAP